jgi:hypothetical protein
LERQQRHLTEFNAELLQLYVGPHVVMQQRRLWLRATSIHILIDVRSAAKIDPTRNARSEADPKWILLRSLAGSQGKAVIDGSNFGDLRRASHHRRGQGRIEAGE